MCVNNKETYLFVRNDCQLLGLLLTYSDFIRRGGLMFYRNNISFNPNYGEYNFAIEKQIVIDLENTTVSCGKSF